MIPGFVRVSVTGEQCERFLNLCRGRDMELRKIIRTGEKEFHVTLKVKDFWKISPLRRKNRRTYPYSPEKKVPFSGCWQQIAIN